jgi:hypothetical protein
MISIHTDSIITIMGESLISPLQLLRFGLKHIIIYGGISDKMRNNVSGEFSLKPQHTP